MRKGRTPTGSRVGGVECCPLRPPPADVCNGRVKVLASQCCHPRAVAVSTGPGTQRVPTKDTSDQCEGTRSSSPFASLTAWSPLCSQAGLTRKGPALGPQSFLLKNTCPQRRDRDTVTVATLGGKGRNTESFGGQRIPQDLTGGSNPWKTQILD